MPSIYLSWNLKSKEESYSSHDFCASSLKKISSVYTTVLSLGPRHYAIVLKTFGTMLSTVGRTGISESNISHNICYYSVTVNHLRSALHNIGKPAGY